MIQILLNQNTSEKRPASHNDGGRTNAKTFQFDLFFVHLSKQASKSVKSEMSCTALLYLCYPEKLGSEPVLSHGNGNVAEREKARIIKAVSWVFCGFST